MIYKHNTTRTGNNRWQRARRQWLDALTEEQKRCHFCGYYVDTSKSGSDPQGPNVHHVKSYRDNPHLEYDRSNWAVSHRLCNLKAGADGRSVDYDNEGYSVEAPVQHAYPGQTRFCRLDEFYNIFVSVGNVRWSQDHWKVTWNDAGEIVSAVQED